ncbi:hypothetical protein BDD12DRAFT_836153 [Trichophaea hybrida]|nr:hypothetical protein BDD12DRAFT_836153 [Trichophaea hybrida]
MTKNKPPTAPVCPLLNSNIAPLSTALTRALHSFARNWSVPSLQLMFHDSSVHYRHVVGRPHRR